MENNLTGNRRVALYVRTATEPASGEVPAYAVQEAHLRDVAASNSTFQIVGVYRYTWARWTMWDFAMAFPRSKPPPPRNRLCCLRFAMLL